MSKKLLFNKGGEEPVKVPNINKYTGTMTGYPIEMTSDILDDEEKTFIEEIYGNTIQNADDLSDIRSVGINTLDEVYEIEVIQSSCPYEFGKGGRL